MPNLAAEMTSTAPATTLLHSDAVSRALRELARGVTPAHGPPPHAESLEFALKHSVAGCSNLTEYAFPQRLSLLHLALCHPESAVHWVDDQDGLTTSHYADASPILDMLLHDSESLPIWIAVRDNVVRQVATAHYVSQSATACDGVAPYVYRLHFFCLAPGPGTGLVPPAFRKMEFARRDDDMPWMVNTKLSAKPEAGMLRCELDGVVELPKLCDFAPYNEPAPMQFDMLLRRVYRNDNVHGYTSRTGEAADDKALTYGELSPTGMLTLLDALTHASAPRTDGQRVFAKPKKNAPKNPSEWYQKHSVKAKKPPKRRLRKDDVFVDVGSGVGKLVLAAALLTRASKAVGLEVDPERAERASNAFKAAKRHGLLTPGEAMRVELSEADATVEGALPADTTLVYLSNLCFGAELTRAIARRLVRLPKLRCVGALRELDLDDEAIRKDASSDGEDAPACQLESVRSLRVGTTWAENSRLHVYCCREFVPLPYGSLK